MTQQISKIQSESELSKRTESTASICSMSTRSSESDFKFAERFVTGYFKEFVECNKRAEGDEVALDHCSRIARRSNDKNPKSFQSREEVENNLSDAGQGQYQRLVNERQLCKQGYLGKSEPGL